MKRMNWHVSMSAFWGLLFAVSLRADGDSMDKDVTHITGKDLRYHFVWLFCSIDETDPVWKKTFSEIWQYVTGRTPGPRFFTLGGTSSFSVSHFRQKRTLALDSLPLRAGGWREKGKAYRNWHVFFLHCYLKCPECQCEGTGVWGPGQGWPSLASFTSLGGARLALTKLLSLFSPRPTD